MDFIPSYIFIPSVALSYCAMYRLCDFVLSKYSDTFNTYETARKDYIVTNTTKSVVLLYASYYFLRSIFSPQINLLRLEHWSQRQQQIKNIASVYAMTDVMSFTKDISLMKWNTIAHHIGVALGLGYILRSDFEVPGIEHALIMYGGWSSLAYLVNTYLGQRFLYSKENKTLQTMKKISFYSYVSVCACNWSWQTYYLWTLIKQNVVHGQYGQCFGIFIYVNMLMMWVNDDLLLMEFLHR